MIIVMSDGDKKMRDDVYRDGWDNKGMMVTEVISEDASSDE